MFGQVVIGTVCDETAVPLDNLDAVFAVTREGTMVAFCLHRDVVRNMPDEDRCYGESVSRFEDGLNIHQTVPHGDGQSFSIDDFAFSITNETALKYLPNLAEDFGIEASSPATQGAQQ